MELKEIQRLTKEGIARREREKEAAKARAAEEKKLAKIAEQKRRQSEIDYLRAHWSSHIRAQANAGLSFFEYEDKDDRPERAAIINEALEPFREFSPKTQTASVECNNDDQYFNSDSMTRRSWYEDHIFVTFTW